MRYRSEDHVAQNVDLLMRELATCDVVSRREDVYGHVNFFVVQHPTLRAWQNLLTCRLTRATAFPSCNVRPLLAAIIDKLY